MNAIRAAKLPVSGRRAAAPGPGLAAGPPRRDAQVIALADYRAQPRPAPVAQRRPAPGAQRRPGAPAPLRLTRRGRIAAAAAAALLAGGLSLAAAVAAQAAGHAVAPGLGAPGRALIRVTVRPGDSLWSLAERADPGADPRLAIQQIIRLNRLGGDTLLAGERLWAPRVTPAAGQAGRPRPLASRRGAGTAGRRAGGPARDAPAAPACLPPPGELG